VKQVEISRTLLVGSGPSACTSSASDVVRMRGPQGAGSTCGPADARLPRVQQCAAVGHDVERCQHLRQKCRISIRDANDQLADPNTCGPGRDAAERDETVEDRLFSIGDIPPAECDAWNWKFQLGEVTSGEHFSL